MASLSRSFDALKELSTESRLNQGGDSSLATVISMVFTSVFASGCRLCSPYLGDCSTLLLRSVRTLSLFSSLSEMHLKFRFLLLADDCANFFVLIKQTRLGDLRNFAYLFFKDFLRFSLVPYLFTSGLGLGSGENMTELFLEIV